MENPVRLSSGVLVEFVDDSYIRADDLQGTISWYSKDDTPSNTLFTLHLRYPRFIHAQVLTHRMFARNSASNRAKSLGKNPDASIYLYAPRARMRLTGMKVAEICSDEQADLFVRMWRHAAMSACDSAVTLERLGYAKEIVNRLIEPFQFIDVVMTGTYQWWQHFLSLRNHPDAQHEIQLLAKRVSSSVHFVHAYKHIVHLPYMTKSDREELQAAVEDWKFTQYPWLDPLDVVSMMVSAARCARVSYRPFDEQAANWRKDLALAFKLLDASPPHMSPFEHQASCAWPLLRRNPIFDGWTTGRDLFEFLQHRANDLGCPVYDDLMSRICMLVRAELG